MPPAASKKSKDKLVVDFLETISAERNAAPRTLIAYRHALEIFAKMPNFPGWKNCAPDHFRAFLFEQMKAAVDVVHGMGKKVAIHSYGPSGARDAIRAGADSLEHATDMDDETIAEMVRKNVYYVPTIDHNRYYYDNAERFNYAPGAKERLTDFIARNLETARKAVKAGARLVMGSDAIYTMFGQNTRELGWFVKAGMTPEQALASATSTAAKMLAMEKSIGAVAPGFYADIVAVEGDPFGDINVVINNVRWVMKGGAVVVDKTKK